MILDTLKTPLTLAILSSTLFIVSANAGDVVGPEVGTKLTTVENDINVKTKGSITAAGVPAVLIDSASTLTVEANNVSANLPGVVATGTPSHANLTFPGVVGVSVAEANIIVESGSGILSNGDGNAISVNLAGASGVSIDNTGTLTGGNGSRASISINNSLAPFILNRAGGTITAPGWGVFLDDTAGVVTDYLIQNLGTISQTGNGNASSAAIYNSGNSTGVIENSNLIISQGTGVASSALAFLNGGHNVSITNNAAGTIESTNSMGINFAATTANNEFTINNLGTIKANTNAIEILGNSKAATVSTVTNAGTITSTTGHGVNFGADFLGTMTNNGTITSAQSGIRSAGTSTLTIVNNNIINATGAGAFGGIDTSGALTGNITNSSAGVITGSGGTMNAFRLGGAIVGDVLNAGTATTDDAFVLNLTGTLTGDFTNTGTMSQTNAAGAQGAVMIDNVGGGIVGKFDNQGTITSAAAGVAAIVIEDNITGGFFNSGTITATGPNAKAIDMITNPPAAAVALTQTGGTITGDIFGHNLGNVMTFTGGTVTGNIDLGNGADVVNLANTTLTGNILGDTNNDTINITGNFSTAGEFNDIKNIEVQNAGTVFTVNNKIGDMSGNGTIKTNAGTTLLFNTGSSLTTATPLAIDNDGLILVEDGVNIDPTANATTLDNTGGVVGVADTGSIKFTKVGGAGTYGFQATNAATIGTITLNGAAAGDSDITGSSIVMALSGNGFIQQGDLFTVMQDNATKTITGSDTVAVSTIIDPDPFTMAGTTSLTLSFVNNNLVPADNVTLSAVRSPFQGLAQTPNSLEMASTLDALVNDPTLHPDLKLAISQLDIQSSKATITEGLESLLPDVNGGLVEVSQGMHSKTVDTVISRLEDARSIYDIVKTIQSGDKPYYGMGGWGKVFGALLSQNEIGGIEGYRAAYSGISTGIDRLFSREYRAGVALGYVTGDVDGKSQTPTDLNVDSFQIAGYGSYDFPGAWYLDTVLSAGLNRYKQTRDIEIGTFRRTAKATYSAWQYSGRLQAGYQMAYEKYRITPIIGASIGMLDIDSYTEATAGGVSLAVESKNVMDAVGTIGVRFLSLNEYVEALYVPEFRVMVHYDFIRDSQQTNANFVGNGTVFFNTVGAKPAPMTLNVGTALTAYSDNLIFSINYDLEMKKQFFGHYVHLKVRYEW